MGVRNITVFILGDSGGLNRALRTAAGDIDRFVAKTSTQGAATSGVFKGLATGAGVAGVAIAAGLGYAATAAARFDAAMHNVNTIAHQSDAQLARTSQSVLSLSRTLPQSAETLAKGLYDVESSGIHGAEALNVLAVSGKAASAGLTTTDVSARAIVSALNAYGLSAASAKDVSDILFKTVDIGITSFGDLANQLGDFVGTAAAAKVPLQDAAAAFAAITKSGNSPAEAATATNRVLLSILRPGKEMAATLKSLGYESGAAALQTRGLGGVMTDLRKATGGASDKVYELFKDVRGGKGALALMANEGRTFQDALTQIGSTQNRAGATQRAYDEQLKSASVQLRLLGNDAQYYAIQLGTHLLPPFVAFVKMARQVGSDAVPYIQAAFAHLQPVVAAVGGILADVARIAGGLAQALGPVAAGLLKVAGAVVLGPLVALLQVLNALTSFLAGHQQVVSAVAAVYLLRFVPAVIAMATEALAALNPLRLLDAAFFTMKGGAASAAAGTKEFAASLITLEGAATLGIGVAIYGLINSFTALSEQESAAKALNDEAMKSFNQYDTKAQQKQLDDLGAKYDHGRRLAEQYGGAIGQLKLVFSQTLGDHQLGDILHQGDQAGKTFEQLVTMSANVDTNLQGVAKQTGLTVDQLRKLAQSQDIDLSKPFEASADARNQLFKYVKDLDKESHGTFTRIAGDVQIDEKALEAASKAAKKYVDAVSSAFQRDTDVLGNFDPTAGVKDLKDAEEALAKARGKSGTSGRSSLADEQALSRARQRVSDTEQRAAVASNRTASQRLSHQQSIARAEQSLRDLQARQAEKSTKDGSAGSAVAEAQQRVAEARAKVAQNNLATIYKQTIADASAFNRNIQTATARGLDPSAVSRLLEEGPKKAGPVLRTILADHSGRLIQLVNRSERALQKLNLQAIENARVLALAINSPDTFFIKHVQQAMAIAQAEAASGGKATAAALARNLRLSPAEVRDVADRFGITIANAVQGAVDNHPIKIKLSRPVTGGRPDPRVFRAEGGQVFGPAGRDAVPAMLTHREYVQPVASVDYYGVRFMDAVRARALPRVGFAGGGLVGRDGAWTSPVVEVSGPRVVAVPVPIRTSSSVDNSVTYNVDRVVAREPRDLGRWYGRSYSATKGVR